MENPYDKQIKETEIELANCKTEQQLLSDAIDRYLIAIGRKVYYKKLDHDYWWSLSLPDWDMKDKYQFNLKKMVKDAQFLAGKYNDELDNERGFINKLTELKEKREQLEYVCQQCKGE